MLNENFSVNFKHCALIRYLNFRAQNMKLSIVDSLAVLSHFESFLTHFESFLPTLL